jgi:hypothetical protein
MTDFWDSLKKGLSEGIKTVSAKTEEYTKIGRLKIEVIAVKRDIEKNLIEFGGKIYHQLNKNTSVDISKDDDLNDLVNQIKSFEKKLKKLEKDIQNIQSASKAETKSNKEEVSNNSSEK